MHQHSNYRGPREEEKKKGYEKIFKEIIVERLSNMGKKITKFRKYRISYRRNSREILNTKKKNIKSSKGKATDNIQEDLHDADS